MKDLCLKDLPRGVRDFFILDGGPSNISLESTVLDATLVCGDTLVRPADRTPHLSEVDLTSSSLLDFVSILDSPSLVGKVIMNTWSAPRVHGDSHQNTFD